MAPRCCWLGASAAYAGPKHPAFGLRLDERTAALLADLQKTFGGAKPMLFLIILTGA